MRRFLATSDHWFARFVRRARRAWLHFGVPAPRIVSVPVLSAVLLIRSIYYFFMRVLICEPLFKAYCTEYGKGVRTGVFLHWVQGRGKLILGNDVLIDGKCSFTFAARFSDAPTLKIGDHSGVGHECSFTVGKEISIGKHCRIAGGVIIFDSPGHPADPAARMAGLPTEPEEVKPVLIEDNVWIGRRAIIMPGVTIGEGSVIAAGSVVMGSVPPNTFVAGNPARQVRKLTENQTTASKDVQVN